jgi:acetyl esterase/lipase
LEHSSASAGGELADPRLDWRSLSAAERDAAYDNNGAVKNSAALIAERNTRSADVRAARAASLDIPYGSKDRTKFDLYPGAEKTAPCLVFLHGGYWQRNSREAFAMLVEGLAAHGWSVAIPGYTLAPDATLTGITEEISLALDWLARNGSSFGVAGPVILSGWSAGAQLAALALEHPLVAAGLAISGIYDLAPLRDTSLNVALQLTDEEIGDLSPLKRPVVQKPLAIAYGSAELPALVHDALNFHHRRAAAGAPGELVAIAGADHFTILEQLRRPDGILVETARALIDGHAR